MYRPTSAPSLRLPDGVDEADEERRHRRNGARGVGVESIADEVRRRVRTEPALRGEEDEQDEVSGRPADNEHQSVEAGQRDGRGHPEIGRRRHPVGADRHPVLDVPDGPARDPHVIGVGHAEDVADREEQPQHPDHEDRRHQLERDVERLRKELALQEGRTPRHSSTPPSAAATSHRSLSP